MDVSMPCPGEMSVIAAQTEARILQTGLGLQGMRYARIWDSLRYPFVGYDIDPAKLEAAQAAGIAVVGNLTEVGGDINIVAVTTSSDQRAEAIEAAYAAIAGRGGVRPVWLVEKPLTTPQQRQKVETLLDVIGRERVFVNEHYLASDALIKALEWTAEATKEGNYITDVEVNKSKDRVKDVILHKRFQDSRGLAVYGIEMPHMLAIAQALIGARFDVRSVEAGGSIVENKFYHKIDGMEQSEGNHTVLRIHQNGVNVNVVLNQALGPFEINADGSMKRREWGNTMSRTTVVTFKDKRTLTITFDPVPGQERYQSKLERQMPDGSVAELILPDNGFPNVLGAVATFAATSGDSKPGILDLLTADTALRQADQLAELRAHAGSPIAVASLQSADSPETAEQFSGRIIAGYS